MGTWNTIALAKSFEFAFLLCGIVEILLLPNTRSVLLSHKLIHSAHHKMLGEEAALIRFFGDEYINYRQRVGTKIPFIS